MMARHIRSLLAGAACAALALAPVCAGAAASGAEGTDVTQQVQQASPIALPSLAPLADRVLPAVVNISVELNQQASAQEQFNSESSDSGNGPSGLPNGTPFDQFLRRFFQNPFPTPSPEHETVALGSGFIIDPHGYIVTNNHVVAGAEKVTVIFQDHSRHPAKIVGRDTRTDLALLKIETQTPLPYVSWGNSNDVKVGDWVVAVGNPFGLGGTVTAGIVSALGRNINEGPYDDFLQIDAPINRGNSGGPTFNLSGQVVGINTAIYSPSGGSVGIGFDIPSNLAKYVIGQIKAHGKVSWGWLGVAIQDVTPPIAKSLGLNPEHPEGALVASVVPGSPAARAGLKPGDVIVTAGGHQIHSAHDLPRVVAETAAGNKLDLTVERSGKNETLVATIGEMPAKYAAAGSEEQQSSAPASALGMQLAPLGPKLRSELKIPNGVSGVVVTQVAANSPAAEIGVEAGDVIQTIDQKPATTPEVAAVALTQAAKHGSILLLINRNGASEFVGLSVGTGTAPGSAG